MTQTLDYLDTPSRLLPGSHLWTSSTGSVVKIWLPASSSTATPVNIPSPLGGRGAAHRPHEIGCIGTGEHLLDVPGVLPVGRQRDLRAAARTDGLLLRDYGSRPVDWYRLKRSMLEERMEQVRERDGEQAYEKMEAGSGEG